MILLDTDILTLWLIGQPLVSKRVLGSTEDVATTIVSRIELLQGRFAYLLKSSDGVQLQAAQSRLDPDRAPAPGPGGHLIRRPVRRRVRPRSPNHEPETHWPGRPANRQHRACAASHAHHSEPEPLPPRRGSDPGELGRLSTGPLGQEPRRREALSRCQALFLVFVRRVSWVPRVRVTAAGRMSAAAALTRRRVSARSSKSKDRRAWKSKDMHCRHFAGRIWPTQPTQDRIVRCAQCLREILPETISSPCRPRGSGPAATKNEEASPKGLGDGGCRGVKEMHWGQQALHPRPNASVLRPDPLRFWF